MATSTWVIDPTHSEVQFKVKHLVISTVTGSFKSFEGSVQTEGDSFDGASIQFTADVNSIDTNMEQRDGHLKSADFFDAENFPTLSFASTSFVQKGDDEFTLTGDLTQCSKTVLFPGAFLLRNRVPHSRLNYHSHSLSIQNAKEKRKLEWEAIFKKPFKAKPVT